MSRHFSNSRSLKTGKVVSSGIFLFAQSCEILRQKVVFPIPGLPSTRTMASSPLFRVLKISNMFTSLSSNLKSVTLLETIDNLVKTSSRRSLKVFCQGSGFKRARLLYSFVRSLVNIRRPRSTGNGLNKMVNFYAIFNLQWRRTLSKHMRTKFDYTVHASNSCI